MLGERGDATRKFLQVALHAGLGNHHVTDPTIRRIRGSCPSAIVHLDLDQVLEPLRDIALLVHVEYPSSTSDAGVSGAVLNEVGERHALRATSGALKWAPRRGDRGKGHLK